MPERHGHNTKNSGTYRSFHAAKRRCKSNLDYVSRGIEFRFTSFKEFLSLVGERPEGMTLERMDNDGHYESGNVKWATRKEQQNNRRPKKSKLTGTQIADIRSSEEPQKDIAQKYKIYPGFVSRIRSGKRLGEL